MRSVETGRGWRDAERVRPAQVDASCRVPAQARCSRVAFREQGDAGMITLRERLARVAGRWNARLTHYGRRTGKPSSFLSRKRT